MTEIGKFFDCLGEDYTAVIERCFPRYREMLWALLEYLPCELPIKSIVELGCGTGNLSVLLADKYPEAQIHLVDISRDSLDICRQRLGNDRFVYDASDMLQCELPAGQGDLVISSIAIHHLPASQKQQLFSRLQTAIKPGGVFAFADQFAGATPEIYQSHIEHWKAATFEAGSNDEEWEMWMEHQAKHDHHDPLVDELNWLRSAGFTHLDCPWRYLLWAVVLARVPDQ